MILNLSNLNKFVFHLWKKIHVCILFCKILCSSISFNNFRILGLIEPEN